MDTMYVSLQPLRKRGDKNEKEMAAKCGSFSDKKGSVPGLWMLIHPADFRD